MDSNNSQNVNAANSQTAKEPSGCCGGPAPAGTSACCAKDAAVKSTGGTGCGCGPAPQREATARACCS